MFLKVGEVAEEKNRQCGIRAKPRLNFPRTQSHRVIFVKNSLPPLLIPLRKKKKMNSVLDESRGVHRLLL